MSETVRIHGTFLGQPIDVTVSQCEDGQPDEPDPSEVKSDIEPPAAAFDTSAEGEVIPGGDGTTAPVDGVPDEVPPNPEGNAEQL